MLLERYTTLGGSSHVFRRRGSPGSSTAACTTSPNAARGGLAPQVFAGLGLDDRVQWLPMDVDGFDRIVAPGFELATPFGWDRYRENLLESFPDEQRAVRRFHAVRTRQSRLFEEPDMNALRDRRTPS
jgi:all-trans-retinol 13,14-reductase